MSGPYFAAYFAKATKAEKGYEGQAVRDKREIENLMPSRPSGTIDKSPRQARSVRRRGFTFPIFFFVPRGRFIRKRSLLV
jgi:hypothetical protein